MKISRQLNLVQSFETESGTVYLHSMPLSLDMWKSYFLILSKTYSQIFAQGVHIISGPAVASLMLEQIARADGTWDGPDGVRMGLLPEIRRLSNVIVASSTGRETLPFEEALRRKLIDDETLLEMEGALVFFICASAVLRGPKAREKLMILLGMMESQWGVLTTSSDCMEFGASLPTSMPVESSGEKKAPASLVPY